MTHSRHKIVCVWKEHATADQRQHITQVRNSKQAYDSKTCNNIHHRMLFRIPLGFLISEGCTEALEMAQLGICCLPLHVLPFLLAQFLKGRQDIFMQNLSMQPRLMHCVYLQVGTHCHKKDFVCLKSLRPTEGHRQSSVHANSSKLSQDTAPKTKTTPNESKHALDHSW